MTAWLSAVGADNDLPEGIACGSATDRAVMKEIRCNSHRGRFAPHYIGRLDDQGILYVPASLKHVKDPVTGLKLWAMQGRSRRPRRWKEADMVPGASQSARLEADRRLAAALESSQPGAKATCVVDGTEFIGTLTNRGTVDVTWDDPPDRPTSSVSLLPTPCMVRCWCKSIITVSKS